MNEITSFNTKANIFIDFTNTYNNFRINYTDARNYLLKILNEKDLSNKLSIDPINYEKIFYIEQTFKESQEIILLLNKIKKIISDNYFYKQKLLNRLILKTTRDN